MVNTMRKSAGFTLIELMITVTIAAILAAVAIPAYTRYVQRGDLVEATQALMQYRVMMEQFYQDNRSYAGAGVGGCGVAAPALVNFTLTCAPNNAGQTYLATATGILGGPVAGFSYTIDQSNNQTTAALPAGWSGNTATSWVVR